MGLAVIYFVTALPDKRRLREIELWRGSWGPVHAGKPIGAKRVGALPAELRGIVAEVGAGAPLGLFELVPKAAYLVCDGSTATSSTDHTTVVALLAEPAAGMVARPLPLIDGQRVINTGIMFKKDPEFSLLYLVEGEDAKAIKVWLSPPVREELCDKPDLWLRTRGRVMALTQYGPPDADRMDELLAAADVIFAEYGAVDASLLGDDIVLPEPGKKKAKKKDAPPRSAGAAQAATTKSSSKV